MAEPSEEIGAHLQVARDKVTEARRALEQDPGEETIEDHTVLETIRGAIHDMDYALAKATWHTKDHLAQAAEAADEGWDDLVEDLGDARDRVAEYGKDLSESQPVHAIGDWLQGMEDRLDALMARLGRHQGK